ncbi:MAG: class II aldolase/adducin family protein [Pseudomonadota bacterium]
MAATNKIPKQDLDALKQDEGFDIPDPAGQPSLRGEVSEVEWRARCDLAATYRLVALYGWDDMVFTHISMRAPDEGGAPRFLINPYGVFFEEMTASCLLKVDTEGQVVGETPYFANPAGFTIHSAVHAARADAHCVLHLHSDYGVAVSAQKDGLRKLTQFSMVVHDDVAYHDYEGIALDLDERERIVADMGAKNFLMLRNHGTLTVGENCATAFLRMYFLEKACKAQILAQAGGVDNLVECDDDMSELVGKQGAPAFVKGLGDALAWPGILRKLNRVNPGFDY